MDKLRISAVENQCAYRPSYFICDNAAARRGRGSGKSSAGPVRCNTLYSASANGATLVGNEGSGRFSHEMARGVYHSIGKSVIVTITDKQWRLPWPVVEAQLRERIL